MVCIEAIFVGEPQSITDEKGTWFSAIYRAQVNGPIELRERGLLGDRVADTRPAAAPEKIGHQITRAREIARQANVLGQVDSGARLADELGEVRVIAIIENFVPGHFIDGVVLRILPMA